jgi:hypothetical protein
MAYDYRSFPETERITKILCDIHCQEIGLDPKDFEWDDGDLIKIVYVHKRPTGSTVRYMLGMIETGKDGLHSGESEIRAYKFNAQVSFAAPVFIEPAEENSWAYKVAAKFNWLKGTNEEIEDGIVAVRKALTESVKLINEVEAIIDEALGKLEKIMRREEGK